MVLVGDLNIVSVDQSNQTVSLWSMSGNQGTAWKRGYVTIGDTQTTDYQIQIIGTIKNIISSDIAIDDIATKVGACSAKNQPATGKQVTLYVVIAFLQVSK